MSDQQTADAHLTDADERLEIVRSVWREVLGVAEVADDITFFDQGGDSLRLVLLVERLNQTTGRALKTVDLFRAGTVKGHSELLAESDNSATSGFRGTSRADLINAARARRP
ncbi:phosphopantetheine-binding protein [Kibdelosporangium aridum]|uniref:phosphopantetheine-binding protein n=1 Tax=Kibdelosporangium aridum TaxID=2030 RepID=UPI0035E9D858